MAILEDDVPWRGKHGDMIYSQVGDRVIVRAYNPTIDSSTRTVCQMIGRMTWRNMQNAWKYLKSVSNDGLKECPDRRCYEAFLRLNSRQHPVYLTKKLAKSGACIITDYMVSNGSLPIVKTAVDEGIILSDIALGGLALAPQTTVGQLSDAILENNPAFQLGDQLAVWVGHQQVKEGIPTVQPQHYRLTLDPNDTAAVDPALIASHGGYLSLPAPIEGAAVWVHFGPTPDRLLASTQFLTVTNPLLLKYITEDAFKEARESYGVGEKALPSAPKGRRRR